MQNKVSAWKKTAVATVALSMLAGSATGLVASAKNRGHDDDHNNYQSYGGNQQNGNHDDDDEGDDNKGRNYSKNVNVKYNLDFTDLNEQEWKWAYQFIIRLAAEGVFKGYDDGSFKPRANISRIETIVAAVRLLGLEAEAQKTENMNATLNFKDFNLLKKKYPQAVGYVKVALVNDLFNENDQVIQAEKPATRLWASVLLVKAMKLEAQAKAKMDAQLDFRDADDIPAGSVGYVAVAIEKGLVAGYSDKTFQPNKSVTRAELAAILGRLGQQLPDQALPGDPYDNTAISGVVQISSNGTITIKKADSTTINVTLDATVFIFRQGVKVPVSSLQIGDQLTVRISQGKVIFVEVTKEVDVVLPLTDVGKVNSFTLNAQGKLATISVTKDVNGTSQTIVYNVDANVTISGGAGALAPNQTVIVKGENNVVKTILIQP